ncbi:MAG: hypothetical protein JSW51_04035 [Gemmatimonadota bacterium]|nr:MAG: hypothetical protein JSW51_04035 [Gemmatimonadota bacterium]
MQSAEYRVQIAECRMQGDHGRWFSRLKVSLPVAFTAAMLSACGANRTADNAQCTSMAENIDASTSAATLVGEYVLTMVATTGAQQSSSESGELALMEHSEENRYFMAPDGSTEPGVTVPLYGTTTVVLDGVGAVKLGDLDSNDPMKPGVAVLEHRQGSSVPDIVLRLGSFANDRDITRFDGGFTALRVKWVRSSNFGGTWESGVTGVEASGYFCAVSR